MYIFKKVIWFWNIKVGILGKNMQQRYQTLSFLSKRANFSLMILHHTSDAQKLNKEFY